MIGFEQAQELMWRSVKRLDVVAAPFEQAVGLILAEDVVSQMDLPRWDNSAMDGFAVRIVDLADVPVTLTVTETIPAGVMPRHEVCPGHVARIMTGAPIPDGADTVVIVEHTQAVEASGPIEQVRIEKAPKVNANIRRQGEEIRSGTTVLSAGARVRPAEIALLATLGIVRPKVYRRPSIAILATGDEVIEPDCPLSGAQIHNSNSHTVRARLQQLDLPAKMLGIAPDRADDLKRYIEDGLKSDLLIISGGVSMGSFDLIPQMLIDCGVELLFEKVAIKPGAPTVFGRHAGGYVFGLPGNPVSALVITELFVIPALKVMMGMVDPTPTMATATLDAALSHRPGRRSYRPVLLVQHDHAQHATPVVYQGSADLMGLSRGNALAIIPADVERLEPGDTVEVVVLE